MEEKIYHHKRMPANGSKILRKDIVRYDNADILVLQKSNQYISPMYTVVLGQILQETKTKDGKPITTFYSANRYERIFDIRRYCKKSRFSRQHTILVRPGLNSFSESRSIQENTDEQDF